MSKKTKQKKQGKVIGQGTMHKIIVNILDIVERMYQAQRENENALPFEEFITYLKQTTPNEFYELEIKEKVKNENICVQKTEEER